MEDRVKRIEKALDHFLPERKGSLSETVTDAMRYSLLNGRQACARCFNACVLRAVRRR